MSTDTMLHQYQHAGDVHGLYKDSERHRDQLKTEAMCRIADNLEQLNMRLAAMGRLDEARAATQQAQLAAIITQLGKLTGDEQ
ncbi:hypothetical protein [Bifidobacterium stellenboschense]|uniref:Uncharacterized protein n=1 Tax=Bifidobacterium stellenboschense TaxID=762211 RepID=A0A087DMY3_9BIFI|nr:hypothetical protein [Bifidobacterium stellenboschense]KFI96883.1 hypothetical protein BSTEL_1792 [Bifidobacterium stellenboschense]